MHSRGSCREGIMNYAQQELAIRLRKRQAELLAQIQAEDPARGVTGRLQYLAKAKYNTDATLADIAEELGLQDNFHQMLDKEIAEREGAARIWGRTESQ